MDLSDDSKPKKQTMQTRKPGIRLNLDGRRLRHGANGRHACRAVFRVENSAWSANTGQRTGQYTTGQYKALTTWYDWLIVTSKLNMYFVGT